MRLQTRMMSLGLGAGAMYLLDPQQGKRRRALVRDQLVHLGNVATSRAGKAARDLGNRTRGLSHEVAARLHGEQVDDVVLHDRVRARLGHVVSHPSAIAVGCDDGCCTLSGPVTAEEREGMLAAVAKVRGVRELVDRLEVHETSDVAALEGGRATEDELAAGVEPQPAGRRTMVGLLAGSLLVAGGGLLLRSLRRRGRVELGSRRRSLGEVRLGAPAPPQLPDANGDGALAAEGESLMLDGGEPLAPRHSEPSGTPHH